MSNIASVSVKAGDKVTVTIWQLSGTTWEINLTDDTDNQSFTTPPEQYSGPGSSAEWVVEATTECRYRCRTVALAPYSPPVVFSGLGMTGPPGNVFGGDHDAPRLGRGFDTVSPQHGWVHGDLHGRRADVRPAFGTARLAERRAK